MSEPGIDELKVALHEKIRLGEQLLVRLSKLDKIDGLGKLHKKVKQEINFLHKVWNVSRGIYMIPWPVHIIILFYG